MRYRTFAAVGGAIALSACATADNGSGEVASTPDNTSAEAPYASTYEAYPGTPTALVGDRL